MRTEVVKLYCQILGKDTKKSRITEKMGENLKKIWRIEKRLVYLQSLSRETGCGAVG